jgi:hypothetical protein
MLQNCKANRGIDLNTSNHDQNCDDTVRPCFKLGQFGVPNSAILQKIL